VTCLTVFAYHFTQQADINYYQGHRFFLKGQYEKAIPFYETAIEEGSNRIEDKELKKIFTKLTSDEKRHGSLIQDLEDMINN